MNGDIANRTVRRTIASTDSYAAAEAVVDRLADDGFPVEHVAIVGRDLRFVEQVIGHVNGWKAALSGAGSGLMLGLLFGLLFGIWFAHDGTSLLAILAYWAGFGAAHRSVGRPPRLRAERRPAELRLDHGHAGPTLRRARR